MFIAPGPFVRPLFRLLCPGSGARVLYVSGTGSDSNDGLTSSTPLRQISTAIGKCRAGDRISVASGTYASASFYNIQGSNIAWITLEGPGDDTAVIDGTTGNDGAAALDVQLGTFIGIYGLTVTGSQNMTPVSISGIAIFRHSHHIRIWGCHVHDFPSGGINCFYVQSGSNPNNTAETLPAGGWDLVDVAFNQVHGCCKYDPNNSSAVSIFGAEDITGITLDGTYGYRVVGNYLYDIECTKPYTAGGFNYVTDGNGISLDSLNTATVYNAGNAPYVKRGLVSGNVVVGCGGRGLHIYNTINVDNVGNTYVGNLRTNSPAINGGVEADASYDNAPASPGVIHSGNVIIPLNTPNTTDAVSSYIANVICGGLQAVPSGNTDRRSKSAAYLAGAPTAADLLTGLALSVFVPVTPDPIFGALSSPYQPLGFGWRGVNRSAGALDPAPVVRTLVAH